MRIRPGEFDRFNADAQGTIVLSERYAVQVGHPQTTPEHLALALASPQVAPALLGFEVDFGDLNRSLTHLGWAPGHDKGEHDRPFDDDLKAIVEGTFRLANEADDAVIGPEHLLVSLVRRHGTIAARALVGLHVDPRLEPSQWRPPRSLKDFLL